MPARAERFTLAFLLPAAASVAVFAAASATVSGDVYRLSWRREIPIVALSAATLAGSRILWHGIGRPPCPCEASGINGLDRGTAGRRDGAAARASDVVADFATALPFVLDALDIRGNGNWDGFDSDAAVMLEALALNAGIDQMVKAATHRPRPLLYGLPAGNSEMTARDNYRSFYSGHTSGAFAIGIAYARTYALRHPGSGARWAVYGGAVAVGTTIGALRVAAGEHFPTDVIAAAAAGTAIGLLVPALHRAKGPAAAALSPYRGGLALRVTLALR